MRRFWLVGFALLLISNPALAASVSVVDKSAWDAIAPAHQAAPDLVTLTFGDKIVLVHDGDAALGEARVLARHVDRADLYLLRDWRPMAERVGYDVIFSRSAFKVAEVAQAQPRPDPETYRVYVHGIRDYKGGLYDLDDLGTYGNVAPHLKHYAAPRVRLPGPIEQRLALMRQASAALVAPRGVLAPEERGELSRRFVEAHRYRAFAVYLLR